ncbi:MAG: redoxin family protein [Pseudomonadota bacterium]
MLKTLALSALSALFLLPTAAANAAVEPGQPAPDFTGTDTNGVEHTLSGFKGKTVVLEWTNHECPYVVKHYGGGNMQALQKAATDDGVVWVSVVSSAPGKQGFVDAESGNKVISDKGSNATAKILDPDGSIGKLFGAKTTPHMFVIDPEGNIAYAGAIDSNSSFDPATIEGATNYVSDALASIKAGKPIEVASTTPYGCSVKY